MESTTDQALQAGVAAHREGKLQDAERLYRAILQSQPNHPDANHNLGLLVLAMGKPSEAAPLFKMALDTSPQVEQFWLSYIDVLIRLEHFDEAKRVLVEGERAVVSLEHLDAFKLRLQGSPSGSEPSQDQINHLMEHYQAGRLGEAEPLAAALTQQFPEHPFAWKVLGAVFKKTGRLNESFLPMQKAVELSPQDAEVHSNLGVVLQELGRLAESEQRLRQAIALRPSYAEARYNLGNTLQDLGRLDDSEKSYQTAIALKPDHAQAHSNLGVTLQRMGRLGEAEASYRQAIVLKPDYAEAHRHLTTTTRFSSQDEQVRQMQALYLDPDLSDDARCHICFALAKVSEDLGDCAAAFQFYAEGNALQKKQLGYEQAEDTKLFETLKTNHPRIAASSLGSEIIASEHTPIFVVGMPRSGTTLVEQIISSHPLVTGAGELPFVSQFGLAVAAGQMPADEKALTTFRDQYLNALQQRSEGKAIVTDKMPHNFRLLGLITAALPEAKIVHVKRLPAAVCWANYTQRFLSGSLRYSYSLDDILHYHELYQDLMRYWHQALPGRIYDLDYEVLTEHQEPETRRLIGHLGLEWDEVCLSPQDNNRSVSTASNAQIRQKVYRGSSEKWKRYRPYLNGALDHLSGSDNVA